MKEETFSEQTQKQWNKPSLSLSLSLDSKKTAKTTNLLIYTDKY